MRLYVWAVELLEVSCDMLLLATVMVVNVEHGYKLGGVRSDMKACLPDPAFLTRNSFIGIQSQYGVPELFVRYCAALQTHRSRYCSSEQCSTQHIPSESSETHSQRH